MDNVVLDNLVSNGDIESYSYQAVDEDGNIGQESRFRNTEQLVLVFASGRRLVLDTFCSGCAENTCLVIK